MTLIHTQSELDTYCQALSTASYVLIDTEFLRDKTYYPQLCLIQLSAPHIDPVAIDPLVPDLDMQPVWDLMGNKKILKVFHAARQDLEIMFYHTGTVPTPIFDTQIAAMVCDFGDNVAYNVLVEKITGTHLKKNAQFTDWSKRPLSTKQMQYAIDDVVYLDAVYLQLDKLLKERDRIHWLKQEMSTLESHETYQNNPEDSWKRIKIRSDNSETLMILKELAAWREQSAKDRNVPRSRVIKDESLADIALYCPQDKKGLSRIRNLSKEYTHGNKGDQILELIKKARNTPKDLWPYRERKKTLPKSAAAILEMLKLLLKVNAVEAGVVPKLIASNEDLIALARDNDHTILAMQGWRDEIFGKDARDLVAGNISIGIHKGKIKKFYHTNAAE